MQDIRQIEYPAHKEVVSLPFIPDNSTYVYRRHYENGMRAHIFQILHAEDVLAETKGRLREDGTRDYSRAEPKMMLRINKKYFGPKDFSQEAKKIKLLKQKMARFCAYTLPSLMDYIMDRESFFPILIEFQEHIKGKKIKPWNGYWGDITSNIDGIKKSEDFINAVKNMADTAGYVPDLAGSGNIYWVKDRGMVLIDQNNIVQALANDEIPLDDMGYPTLDKSIEALSLIEIAVLGELSRWWGYKHFLDKGRMREARDIDLEWHEKINGLSRNSRHWLELAASKSFIQ